MKQTLNGNYGLVLALALFVGLGIFNAISRVNIPAQAFTTTVEPVPLDFFSRLQEIK